MIERLKAIQDTYNGLSKEGKDRYIRSFDTDSQLQEEVRVLAKHFLNRTIKGCSWCALGAFLDLLRLNQKDMEQKENSNKLGFQLLAGTLLHDPINKDFSKILTPQSLTDELALYHLALNPRAKEYFARMPDNVDELVDDYIREQSEGALKDAGDVKNRQINAMKTQLAIMQKAYDNIEASQKERKAEIDALSARISEVEKGKKSDVSDKVKEVANKMAKALGDGTASKEDGEKAVKLTDGTVIGVVENEDGSIAAIYGEDNGVKTLLAPGEYRTETHVYIVGEDGKYSKAEIEKPKDGIGTNPVEPQGDGTASKEDEYTAEVHKRIVQYNDEGKTITEIVDMFAEDVAAKKITKTRIKEMIKEGRGSDEE